MLCFLRLQGSLPSYVCIWPTKAVGVDVKLLLSNETVYQSSVTVLFVRPISIRFPDKEPYPGSIAIKATFSEK